MTGDRDDPGQTPEQPWHHSTPAVLGASVAALTVIALVVWGLVALTSNADKPQDAPIEFVDPTFASTSTRTSAPTTTPTITRTSPPETTEFGLPTDVSGTTGPSPSDTSGSSTPESSGPSVPPRTRSDSDDEDDESPTSRSRPRTNVTRTLYPVPGN